MAFEARYLRVILPCGANTQIVPPDNTDCYLISCGGSVLTPCIAGGTVNPCGVTGYGTVFNPGAYTPTGGDPYALGPTLVNADDLPMLRAQLASRLAGSRGRRASPRQIPNRPREVGSIGVGVDPSEIS